MFFFSSITTKSRKFLLTDIRVSSERNTKLAADSLKGRLDLSIMMNKVLRTDKSHSNQLVI